MKYVFEEIKDFWSDMLPILVILIIMVSVILLPFFALSYISSCKQVNVYNTKNQTSYSCSDFFWAGSQINSQTQTINLNK